MLASTLPLITALTLGFVVGGPAKEPPPTDIERVERSDVEIPFERYTLDNGLEVILHRDPSVPEISVNLWYHVGSGDEVPGKSGFAHLFEHMMFQGAKHIGEDVHFDILKEIGASGVNGTTNTDRTNYFETVPTHEIETALWLESDRMGYLLDLLDQESLDNQIAVVRNERRQRYDNRAYGRARFAIAAALYPEGHPYRYLTIGRHEDLENASLEDVRAFFRKWYVPSNATLTLAGDFEIEEVKALVDKWFGSFPELPKPTRLEVARPELEKTHREVIEDPFAKLERVQYVWHAPASYAEDSYELWALGSILSASWGNLHRRLVLDEKLCQRVFAYHDGQQHTGTFNIVATLHEGADRARVEAILAEELQGLLHTPVSGKALDRVKIGAEAGFVWGLESLGRRADRLQSFNHYTGDPGYVGTYLDQLREVSPASLRDAVKKWLAQPRVEVITVPGKKKSEKPEKGAKS
jgi:predicted Zn-dependent peptidase